MQHQNLMNIKFLLTARVTVGYHFERALVFSSAAHEGALTQPDQKGDP